MWLIKVALISRREGPGKNYPLTLLPARFRRPPDRSDQFATVSSALFEFTPSAPILQVDTPLVDAVQATNLLSMSTDHTIHCRLLVALKLVETSRYRWLGAGHALVYRHSAALQTTRQATGRALSTQCGGC